MIGVGLRDQYEFDPNSYGSGGLLGRLLALQAEQSQEQSRQRMSKRQSLIRDPNFRQLSRARSADSAAAAVAPPELVAQPSEADQAQRARDVAAARLAQGVRSHNRAKPTEIWPSQSANPINGAVRAFANGVPVVGAFNNNVEAAFDAGPQSARSVDRIVLARKVPKCTSSPERDRRAICKRESDDKRAGERCWRHGTVRAARLGEGIGRNGPGCSDVGADGGAPFPNRFCGVL